MNDMGSLFTKILRKHTRGSNHDIGISTWRGKAQGTFLIIEALRPRCETHDTMRNGTDFVVAFPKDLYRNFVIRFQLSTTSA
jgi:hypothetical protein